MIRIERKNDPPRQNLSGFFSMSDFDLRVSLSDHSFYPSDFLRRSLLSLYMQCYICGSELSGDPKLRDEEYYKRFGELTPEKPTVSLCQMCYWIKTGQQYPTAEYLDGLVRLGMMEKRKEGDQVVYIVKPKEPISIPDKKAE